MNGQKAIEETKGEEDKKTQIYKSMSYEIDPKLGLVFKDYDLISLQRMMGFTLLQRISSNLIHGKSVLNVSFPLTISDSNTLLDLAVLPFRFANEFIQPLVLSTDPIERMKKVMAFLVASMHIAVSQRKPLISLLGETLSAHIGDLGVYAEQTTQVDSNFLIIGNEFRIYGKRSIIGHTYANSVKIESIGRPTIEINGPSPVKYRYTYPDINTEGTVVGTRVIKFDGNINVKDATNKLYGQLRLNPYKAGYIGSWFRAPEYRSDHVKGFITKNKKLLKVKDNSVFDSCEIIAGLEGYWIEKLDCEGKCYWDINRTDPAPIIEGQEKILPSDSRLRNDLKVMIAGNMVEAERLRDEYEEHEENDRRLRERASKS